MHAAPLILAALLAGSPVVDLHTGDPAPYDGALCDSACAEGLRAKRKACELENEKLQALLIEKDKTAQTTDVMSYARAGLVGFLVGVVVAGSAAAYLALR